jgi:hypothetical protein
MIANLNKLIEEQNAEIRMSKKSWNEKQVLGQKK